jgi:ABC-2 type transport system permease protein
MRTVLAIASRELGSYFRLPVGWIVIALFLFLTGVVFSFDTLTPGEPATLRHFFVTSGLLMTLIAPAVSMRLISEELRSGTIETLMTTPASDSGVILGKYLGACGFLAAMLLPTAAFPITLFVLSEPAPDVGPILAGYLALLLLGMLFVAVGLLASAMTSSQTLAFLGTLFVLIGLLLLTAQVAPRLPEPYGRWVSYLSLTRRVEDFAKGVIDTTNVVFLLSASVWFLVLAMGALESRRWR